MRASLMVLVVASLLIVGCPTEKASKPAADAGPCSRVGQTCEFSPGKLGICVQRETCADSKPECLVCQSQH